MLLCRNCGTLEHLCIIKGVCQQGPEKALSKTDSCHKSPSEKRVASAVVVPTGGNDDVVSQKATHMLEERRDGTLADEELRGGELQRGESDRAVNEKAKRLSIGGAVGKRVRCPHCDKVLTRASLKQRM